ncbi:MAG: hypothetical protein NUW06_05585 [Candidatus Acetothermia bacterium]|jgi:hypothetical protein|nr:hypothetical protein [Candidatus Acetothermia bacterium]MDH7506036.1 hypothetical protein [Candidatus Acetothermia bacterium]
MRRLLRSLLLLTIGLAPGALLGSSQEADFSGSWAQIQVASEIAKVPFIGEVNNRNITLLRLTQAQRGESLTVTAQICAISVESGTPLVSLVFPEAFIQSLEIAAKPATIEPTDGGYHFFQPRFTQLRGVRLEDPQLDPLPTEASDPRVFDQDGDGHPGLSVRITLFGFIKGEVYVIQRDWTALRGMADSPDRIDGLMEWGLEQVVLGASNPVLRARSESRPDPVPEHSYFRTTRIPPEMDCAWIVANRDWLFAR